MHNLQTFTSDVWPAVNQTWHSKLSNVSWVYHQRTFKAWNLASDASIIGKNQNLLLYLQMTQQPLLNLARKFCSEGRWFNATRASNRKISANEMCFFAWSERPFNAKSCVSMSFIFDNAHFEVTQNVGLQTLVRAHASKAKFKACDWCGSDVKRPWKWTKRLWACKVAFATCF